MVSVIHELAVNNYQLILIHILIHNNTQTNLKLLMADALYIPKEVHRQLSALERRHLTFGFIYLADTFVQSITQFRKTWGQRLRSVSVTCPSSS